ncbi:MAG: hypothetical protein J5769_02740 [Bacteroidales bacterium]|nr:hypothetical protein [Bacteroidales bacterium]
MKKLLLLIIGLFLAFASASAQYATSTGSQVDPNSQAAFVQKINYTQLLNKENSLLHQRAIALTICVSGFGLVEIGSLMRDETNSLTNGGAALVLIGGLGALGSGTWLIINEYQLINTRKKINDHLILQVNPNGLQVTF